MSEQVDEAMDTDKKDIKDNNVGMEKTRKEGSTSNIPTNSAFIETLCLDQNISQKR
jgi:hypothetical protein